MTLKQKILRGSSFLIILMAIVVITNGVYNTKFWIPADKKIAMLSASTGASVEQIKQMTGDCLGYIEPGCVYVPITTDHRITVQMASVNTIGGKWGGSTPIVDTSLKDITVTQPKRKNWSSSISDQPSKEVEINIRMTLGLSDQPIHNFHETRIQMEVVMPIRSGANQFSDKTETYIRELILFTVDEEEFNLLVNLNNVWDGILNSFFFGMIILFIALITYVNSIDTPPTKRRK